MAKKDKKAAKLPKQIAGVRVPKRLRKSPVLNWLTTNELVREALVSATLAAIAAVWSAGQDRKKGRKGVRREIG